MRKNKLLSCVLILCLAAMPACAETTKHERVFAVLNADGEAQTIIDSVRLENGGKLDALNDKTGLSGIENVKDDRAFTLDGETLVWQADGKDIWYQGKSEGPLPVVPSVRCTLDGEEIAPDALKGKSGALVLTVSYKDDGKYPRLFATGMILSNEVFTDISIENGFLVDDGSHTLAVGYGVTGIDLSQAGTVSLPTSMTLTANVNGFDLTDITTVSSSQPLSVAANELSDTFLTADTAVSRMNASANAVKNGKDLFGKDLPAQLVKQINALVSGADSLSAGAATLSGGLTSLTEQSGAINGGMDQLLGQTFAAANAQLSAYQLPALTKDNYAETLSGACQALKAQGADVSALEALKTQLDQLVQLTNGVAAYTSGVAQAQAGAQTLAQGASTLSESLNTAKQEGTDALSTLLKDKVSPLLQVYRTASESLKAGETFDQKADGMNGTLIYIIRTQLTKANK